MILSGEQNACQMLHTSAGIKFHRSVPGEASNGTIKSIRDIMRLPRLSILHKEPPFISFEAGACLRAPSEIFSIPRIERCGMADRAFGHFLGWCCIGGWA